MKYTVKFYVRDAAANYLTQLDDGFTSDSVNALKLIDWRELLGDPNADYSDDDTDRVYIAVLTDADGNEIAREERSVSEILGATIDKTIISRVADIIAAAEKFKSAYFFTPPSHAGDRRSYENYHSVPEFSFTDADGDTWTLSYTVRCSCHNVYASGDYYRNGKKTTLTAVKNLYKRIAE